MFQTYRNGQPFRWARLLTLLVMLLPLAGRAQVVISQIYAGGGSGTAGTTYKRDYVELFNRGATSVDISNYSIQYASATSTTGSYAVNAITATPGTAINLQPGQFYTVVLGSAGTAGADILQGTGAGQADYVTATSSSSLSNTAAKLALTSNSTALGINSGPTPPTSAALVDFVGFGTTANAYEGTGRAPAPTSTVTALFRAGSGCTDSNDNAADFANGTPVLRNRSTTLAPCSAPATCAAPGTPSFSGTTSTSTVVSFTPNATNVGPYTVTAVPATGTTVTATGSGSPITLSGLAPSTSYSVTVTGTCTAATGGGTSPTSTAATATTPATPCTAPTGVAANSIGTTTASISFTGNATATGGYTVTYTAAGGTTLTQAGTASPIALSGLTPNTTYTVTVSSNCGGTTTATSTPAITFDTQAPVPTLTSINPTSIPAGQTTTVTFTGTDFISGATVSFNGANVPTNVTSSTTLTADLAAPASTTTTTFPVAVTTTGGTSGTQTLTVTGTPTGFFEPFEMGTKGAYTTGSVTLATGSYTFDEALLGTANNDLKNGAKSARIRQGSVTMNFDKANGAGTITLLAGNYSGDSNGQLVVSVSNGGTTAYTAYISPTTAVTNTLQPYTFTANIAGPVRIRISNSAASGRISVDDLQISDYTAPVACSAPGTPTFSNITQTSADVTVAAGPNGTGPFTVTATPAGGGTAITATGASPVGLTGLTAGTSYSVTVTSNCNTGFASPSQPSTAVTLTTAAAPAPTLAVTQGATSYPSGGTAYSFGSQTLATTSAPVAFTLTNSGTGTLTISSIVTTGNFAVSGTAPTTIGAGSTATVSVTFTPTATGTRTGTLVINSNATTGATYTVNLTGNGTAVPAPEIDVLQGATAYASGSTYSGFPTTTVGSFSPVSFTVQNTGSATLTISSLAATGDFTASGPATPFTIAAGNSATVSAVFGPTAPGTRTGTITINNNDSDEGTYIINLSGNGQAAALPDLTVSSGTPTAPTPISGNYNNVTIAPGGNAIVSGALTVAGTLAVLPNGLLIQNCQSISGAGSFVLQAGGALAICDQAGIYTTGALGAIRVSGTRSYNAGAAYIYNGTSAQVTGPGLPAQVAALGVNNATGLTLSQALFVSQQVTLQVGNLNTGGQTFTLLSSATGTAVLDNGTQGSVVNGTATVQRYINSANAIGYRHYSAPVSNTTVDDLATANFTPTFNTNYNTSATPSLTTPFPTVFGYDQGRVTTVTSNYVGFDKGWFVPASGSAMTVNRGYTVNAPNTALVDFVGLLNNGAQNSGTLNWGTSPDGGWQFLGNPYPAPLDWSTVTTSQRPGVDGAMYVFQSSGQYGGTYRTYSNGMGTSSLIPTASGYFVRLQLPVSSGSVNLTNANRVTTFGTQPAFGRGAADTRPQLQLLLSGANTGLDEAYIYFEAGATAGRDAEYDAAKLANPSGLNLASLANGEELAINGLPTLGNAAVLVPLTVRVPQAGSYRFEAADLANFAGTATLIDALTGTRTVLTTGTSYAFALAGTSATGRFSVEFRSANALATTAAQALNAQVQLFPNPTSGSFRLQLPVLSNKAAVAATLLNSLGQTVLTRSLSAPAGQAIDTAFDVRGLAAGVYTLRLNVNGTPLVRKVVIE
ncbi:choice-of-anchor D domain-containing protein [Hymenobacter sp. M29]|uniref:Choice-of-anchor D domain-containing protein n=1 Tax=Hymenobacter mellowenesis TaxID=3063995 RepID=A0ABT9AKB9_9BACT|nr:choice-of-anchor D domain-containing protein [Hymenobacter sp. M29]MDO7849531.1 choice-of-anchor D domain-containing protein [Hymenobacter sp. M29]